MTEIVYIVLGFFLLFLGGDVLLKGSVSLARSFGISKFLISAIIIGFGTSMPELMVSVAAALKGSPSIALGNIIGSNIANSFLIIGVSAMIYPLLMTDSLIKRDILFMLAATVLLVVLVLLNKLNVFAGIIFLIMLVSYISWSFIAERNTKQAQTDADEVSEKHYQPIVAFLLSMLGILAIVSGADFLVNGAITIAKHYGISETVIGLTVVAIGSSLPELATGIVAALKKHNDIVLGNVIGSNIFNILAILGVTLLIKPIPVNKHMVNADIWVMLATAVFLSTIILKRIRINRAMGVIMLLCYLSYILFLYSTNL